MKKSLDSLVELAAGIPAVTPGGMLGNTYVKGAREDDSLVNGGKGKTTAYPQHKGKKKKEKSAIMANDLWPSGRPMFNLSTHPMGVVLLGIANDFFQGGEEKVLSAAEKRLARRMAQLGLTGAPSDALKSAVEKQAGAATHTQTRTPLPAPVPTHPDPNFTGRPGTSRDNPAIIGPDPSKEPDPDLPAILDWIKKKHSPGGPKLP
jgi:hypothetical protein